MLPSCRPATPNSQNPPPPTSIRRKIWPARRPRRSRRRRAARCAVRSAGRRPSGREVGERRVDAARPVGVPEPALDDGVERAGAGQGAQSVHDRARVSGASPCTLPHRGQQAERGQQAHDPAGPPARRPVLEHDLGAHRHPRRRRAAGSRRARPRRRARRRSRASPGSRRRTSRRGRDRGRDPWVGLDPRPTFASRRRLPAPRRARRRSPRGAVQRGRSPLRVCASLARRRAAPPTTQARGIARGWRRRWRPGPSGRPRGPAAALARSLDHVADGRAAHLRSEPGGRGGLHGLRREPLDPGRRSGSPTARRSAVRSGESIAARVVEPVAHGEVGRRSPARRPGARARRSARAAPPGAAPSPA